ncbi:NAD-dependent epimerase/dehydratase family protein [Prochlorococcus sp. MIT 0916]|uniref:NAD-dependent epimerase/dehydratase family protein n=1 Tax=Prochlorococcus sp. MIT 0916 TaxID=3082521 RepID=UPI0039B6042E
MKNEIILVTGASGCVGQYIANWLIENSTSELFLWVRDPKKITSVNLENPRIKVLVGDLRQSDKFQREISEVNRVIHTATAWGDPKRAKEVNIDAVKKLLNLLNPSNIKQIIYFSTASVLDRNLNLLPEAFTYGTEYIQTKAQCLTELETHHLASKIIAVFPTLVFGGRLDGTSKFPTSFLTEGLREALRWIWLARWLKLSSKFHFIHAADIAFICGHLATSNYEPSQPFSGTKIKKFVLGQPYISIDVVIQTLLRWKGMRKVPQIPLWTWLVELLTILLPIQMTKWDRFSLKQKHFIHEPVTSPETFGGISYAKNLSQVLHNSALTKH